MTRPPNHARLAEDSRHEAQRVTRLLATELEATAANLRNLADQFTIGIDQFPAADVAAAVIRDYVNRTGIVGTRLCVIVSAASRADAQQAAADGSSDR